MLKDMVVHESRTLLGIGKRRKLLRVKCRLPFMHMLWLGLGLERSWLTVRVRDSDRPGFICQLCMSPSHTCPMARHAR